MTENGFSIDALLPPEMALKAEQIGVKKAQIGFYTMTRQLNKVAECYITHDEHQRQSSAAEIEEMLRSRLKPEVR